MKLDLKVPEKIPTPQAIAGWVEDVLSTSMRTTSAYGN
jgi:hypothetical protein